MRIARRSARGHLTVLALFFALTGAVPASAQEALPRTEPSFKGHVGLTPKDSKLDFPQEVKAPKGAPNILLILTDDVGFAASSTFGGPVPTPTMDRLAAEGLRYTQFHTTALCSPTRAALLTWRNHHSNATGVIMELGTGFPGYPPGTKTGDPISPPGGYIGGLQMLMDVAIDPAGNVWVGNNWDMADQGFKQVPDPALSTRWAVTVPWSFSA